MTYAVFGLGVSALSAIEYLNNQDESFFIVNQEEVTTWSEQVAEFKNGICVAQNDFESIFNQINSIIISPGIDNRLPIVKKAKQQGIKIISEIEFAFSLSKTPVIAVTGTNGKTTVCEMLNEALARAGKKVFLGGNIGHAYTEILKNENYDYAVIEVSSFQLENIHTFKPMISIITNITPSHMERYDSFEDYYHTKERIFENNNDGLILSSIDFRKDNSKLIEDIDFNFKETKALGIHNEQNFSIVYEVLQNLKLEIDFQKFINEFVPSPYRIEFKRVINGCAFYNDGKSTNMDSTLAALKSVNYKKCLLILGGKIRDKSIDFDLLKPFAGGVKIKAFGDAAQYIAESLRNTYEVEIFENLESLFKTIDVKHQDVVLFSPCFPSFDLYKNYIKRAEHFNALVCSFGA